MALEKVPPVRTESRKVIWGRVLAWLAVAVILAGLLGALAFLFREQIAAQLPRSVVVRLKSFLPTDQPRTSEYQTALLRLKIVPLSLKIVEGANCRSAGAIAQESDSRLLHVTCDGRFFWFPLQEGLSPEPIDLKLDLGEARMLEFVAGRGRYGQRIVGVHDLLKLRSGDYALTLSRWDDAANCVRFEVATVSVTAKSPRITTLFRAAPCLELNLQGLLLEGHQAGGRLAEPGDGILLVTVGDFGRDGLVRAGMETNPLYPQDPSVPYGKLIELRVAEGSYRIIAMGLRNPQGLVLTRDGRIFETEHGPQGGDELNQLREGGNYGWPHVTYGTDYELDVWPLSDRTGRHDGYLKPTYAWLPSIGVSQLVEIAGFAPEWDGDLLVGSLASRSLWRLRLEGDHAVYAEEIPIGERIRDMIRLADGRIAILSDDGRVVLIKAAAKSARSPTVPEVLAQRCLECHTASPTPVASGRISLAGLVGRDVASWPGATYSPALSAVGGTWSRERLRDYLKNPQAFAPGTTMPEGVTDPDVLETILDALEALPAPPG